MSVINKAINYIQTYGLIKGLKVIIQRKKSHNTAVKEITQTLPAYETLNIDILNKYKDYVSEKTSQNNIFFFWYDGIENAPAIVKMCYKQILKLYSLDYKIILLDKTNIKSILSIPDNIYQLLESKDLSIQMFSDIVRATCIIQLGGIWVDSTVYLPQKIEFSNFLNEYGFYTLISNKTHNFLSYKNIDCSWSTFLIGASKNSPIFQCFLEMMINTINKNKNKPYFLIDILLTLCAVYKLDNNVMLNFAQKNSSTYDCYYLTNHLNYRINQKHLSQITPIPQKLNWRIDINKLKPNSLINSIYADIMKEYL